MKLDILAFAAHPDDTELACSGTMMKHIEMGQKVGVVDLTEGQLGSRGSVAERYEEAKNAAEIIGLSVRDNLGMEDGYFVNDAEHRLAVIQKIRQYQPDVVLCNAPSDRHPDHGRASLMVKEACFYAGLAQIKCELDGQSLAPHRPKIVLQYIQDRYLKPDFSIDITPYWERKMQAIYAFKTQFFNPEIKDQANTPISSKSFIDFLEGRARELGRPINAEFAEGFIADRNFGLDNFSQLV